MKRFFTQDIKQVRERVIAALWFLGEHAFVATLLLVALSSLVAVFLFYQYVLLSPQLSLEVASEFEFQENVFNALLLEFQEEKMNVRDATFLSPKDIFNP